MMGRLFDILAEREDAITKHAFLGAVAKSLVMSPMRTLGAALTGQQLVADSKKMMGAASAARNMAGTAKKPLSTTF